MYAASRERRAFGDGFADDAIDASELLLVDDRAKMHLLRRRVPDDELFCMCGKRGRIGARDAFVHEMPTRCHADLALMKERCPRTAARRRLDSGVFQDDERAVATKLEGDAFESTACDASDRLPNGARPRESDHRDVRVRRERLARFRIARQHVKQPFGQAGFREELRDENT